MTLQKPTYQLTFELELPAPEEEATASPQDAALLLEQSRQAFENRVEKPTWYADYEQLILGGWSFRVAIYIAWASSPAVDRLPGTLRELASLMGLKSTNAIHVWRRKNPAIDIQVSLMQAAPLFKHRADRFNVLDKASLKAGDDYKFIPALKLAFEMTGDHIHKSQIDDLREKRPGDLSEMSDEELAQMRNDLQDRLGSDEA